MFIIRKRRVQHLQLNRIEDVMFDKGFFPEEIAQAINRSIVSVRHYMRNSRQPTISEIFKIADLMGVEARELINSDM